VADYRCSLLAFDVSRLPTDGLPCGSTTITPNESGSYEKEGWVA